MTNEQINIAIAKACGWDFDPIECADWGSRQRWCKSPHGKIVFRHGIPDYCNDLNAMHKTESRFISDASSAMTYAMLLLRVRGLAVVSEYDELNVDYCWHACHASARQRAEAFLKTIGKWEGGPQ